MCHGRRIRPGGGTGTPLEPVVEIQGVEEMADSFPWGVPVLHLIKSPVELRTKEAAHLQEDEGTGMPDEATFEVKTPCIMACLN